MELMRGGDLFEALTDPSGFAEEMEMFSKSYDKRYTDNIVGTSSSTMNEAVKSEIISLQKCVGMIVSPSSKSEKESVSSSSKSLLSSHQSSSSSSSFSSSSSSSVSHNDCEHPLSTALKKVIECGERHWKEKTGNSHKQFAQAKYEV